MDIIFQHEEDVTPEWLDYLKGEVESLVGLEEEEISAYMDREIQNPAFQALLESPEIAMALQGSKDDMVEPMMIGASALNAQPSGRKSRFNQLKNKVRELFCQVVNGIEGVDLKSIISSVLAALIPAFATGIPLLLLPLIVAFIARLLTVGFDAVCNL